MAVENFVFKELQIIVSNLAEKAQGVKNTEFLNLSKCSVNNFRRLDPQMFSS